MLSREHTVNHFNRHLLSAHTELVEDGIPFDPRGYTDFVITTLLSDVIGRAEAIGVPWMAVFHAAVSRAQECGRRIEARGGFSSETESFSCANPSHNHDEEDSDQEI